MAQIEILLPKMGESVAEATIIKDLKPYAKTLGANLKLIAEVMEYLSGFAQKGEFERFISDATIFMDFMSTITAGWQWLKMAALSKEALVTGDSTYSTEFHESKIHTMKFFFKYEMKRTNGLADTLVEEEVLTIVTAKETIV